ncbi:MAG TPA: tetratricopeptide repeat protein, partial [Polyangiaceae bacterium]|nr:tetratricopeptide repeat protein [Polyangiaceae bacterium]
MQQHAPRQRAGSSLQGGDFSFETKIDNEEQLVDAMLASLARGTLPADAWDRLHAAAQRDGRSSELAFAFESASQSKRLKTVQPPLAAEFLFQAGRYFGDVFGDAAAAVNYLERALALAPSHAGAFGLLERVFEKTQQPRKLADLYAATAQHRPRIDQAPLLRRAAELLVQAGGADDKIIDLLQQVLRLEPGDEKNRARLEGLYVKANRLRDVVRLNEQALAADPPPDDDTRKLLLGRVVELYGDKLHEPERAMPHIEQLLALEPTHETARRVAQKLVVIKGLAGRAAAALATAFEASGTPQEVARFLALELENTRGSKRANLLARLGKLKQERLGDDLGAIEAFEQALAIDATDDDLRARYTRLASHLERWADAAKTLSRVLATVKDAAVKAKTTAQLGEMLLRSGDAKRAKTTLAGVLATQDAPPDAVLAAAHSLREVLEGEKDARALCDVLERIAGLEPEGERRREVDERLSELATKLKDVPRAIAAYERLLSTTSRARALEALAPLYEASGDPEKHARLLEERAKDTPDAAQARELMMRAAQVRAVETKDAAGAVATCRAVVARFGPARDVLALYLPLLESQRLWPELAEALAQEAALTEGAERAQTLARLGVVRLQRLRDAQGAVEAFEKALGDDPREKTARVALEKLAGSGEHRLSAARVLEPVYRSEGPAGPLLRVLELRGTLSADVQDRLAALREVADLAASSPSETGRAVEAVGRGLSEAVAAELPSAEWVARLDVVADLATDPKRRASILAKALGDREVTTFEIAALTRAAAEAHAASGDAGSAIALYRRALAHDPQSAELLTRIDELLRDQGSPRERIALYTAALGRGDAARRKDLLHRIASIERHDLGDIAAAIGTYRTALGEDPDDEEAHAALVELLAQTEAFEDLSLLLEGKLTRLVDHPDAAREVRATLATIAASQGDARRAREQCSHLLEDPNLSPDHLDAIEKAATDLGDADLTRRLFVRRAEMAQDPRDQIAWLDKLGELEEKRRGDLDAAATAWKRAGALAEAAGDDEGARRLLGRARKVAPEDRDLMSHLASLCERAGLWAELPLLYAALSETATDDAERVDLALRAADVQAERLASPAAAARHAARAFELAPARAEVLEAFERLSVAAGEVEAFEHAIDHAMGAVEPRRGLDAESEARLVLARARVLGSDPARADDAAAAYRAILADGRFDRSHHAAALAGFETLVARAPDAAPRRADRRWLLEWRAEHASQDERVARMLEWAREEETQFADASHALAIHRRVLGIDPECDEALAATARLALAAGETEDAIGALQARRERAHGLSRTAIELEIAEILVSRTTRWADAVEALRAVLADSPGDPRARALAGRLLAQRATRSDAVAMLERACDATDDAGVRS